MSGDLSSIAARQQEALNLYVAHRDLFEHVLRRIAPVGVEDGLDLVHEFLLDRLPLALRSYKPAVGDIEPWLYTVFLNYAKRWRMESARLRTRWVDLEHLDFVATCPEPDVEPDASLLPTVRAEVEALPSDARTAVLDYFGNGSAAGSVRAVAKKNGWTKHSTRAAILEGLARLAVTLSTDILADVEREVVRLRLAEGLSWSEVARRLRRSEHQARSALNTALSRLATVVGRS